jgi:hypothetical protein
MPDRGLQGLVMQRVHAAPALLRLLFYYKHYGYAIQDIMLAL